MQDVQFSFAQRRVVVTGAAQGIGLEITRSVLAAGATVVAADLNTAAFKDAQAQLPGADRLLIRELDVTDRSSCQSLAESLDGSISILVNNAGITRDKSLSKMSDEEFDQVLATNLTGVFNVTRGLLPKFDDKDQDKRIVNLASVVALYGNFGQSNYVAAKAGVIGLTKTWARELGRKGFTVNAIAPGFIQTAMTAKMPPEVLRGMAYKVPVGRLGHATDIANSCLFLCSRSAGYIHGAVLSVDGGLVI